MYGFPKENTETNETQNGLFEKDCVFVRKVKRKISISVQKKPTNINKQMVFYTLVVVVVLNKKFSNKMNILRIDKYYCPCLLFSIDLTINVFVVENIFFLSRHTMHPHRLVS